MLVSRFFSSPSSKLTVSGPPSIISNFLNLFRHVHFVFPKPDSRKYYFPNMFSSFLRIVRVIWYLQIHECGFFGSKNPEIMEMFGFGLSLKQIEKRESRIEARIILRSLPAIHLNIFTLKKLLFENARNRSFRSLYFWSMFALFCLISVPRRNLEVFCSREAAGRRNLPMYSQNGGRCIAYCCIWVNKFRKI